MKYIISILAILSFTSIFTGFLIESEFSEKFIGFGVVGLFFIVIPLFIYRHWKGKDVKDYMITKESLDRMRDRENQK
ncbi:MAG: hypothetical protein COB73_01210 [Flavobacteriaceae bacterium]|nr:MAG: hypothetical protein COB73_07105 [Flavobacteriaceae bacterium]PCI11739.1 MAG: hypothetical protein COB73_01210 [Flavobacteriaceae bacterium]